MRAALALLVLAGLAGPACAQEGEKLGERPDEGLPDPPSILPETLRGTAVVPRAGGRSTRIDTLRDLYPAITACWTAPAGLAWLERTEITARLSLRADGSLLGDPRITFAQLPPDSPARKVLAAATLEAIRRCMPLPLTAGLGAAVAGRPLAVRFIYAGPPGKGA